MDIMVDTSVWIEFFNNIESAMLHRQSRKKGITINASQH